MRPGSAAVLLSLDRDDVTSNALDQTIHATRGNAGHASAVGEEDLSDAILDGINVANTSGVAGEMIKHRATVPTRNLDDVVVVHQTATGVVVELEVGPVDGGRNAGGVGLSDVLGHLEDRVVEIE